MVLGGHVEVLCEGTVGDKACTFWYTDDVPRAVMVACQRVRVRSPRWARIPGEDLELVCRTPAALVQTEERGQETGGATDPETRELAHSQ